VHPCIIFSKWSQLGAHYFLVYLFQLLYMFRATVSASSGELIVSMRHWYFPFCMGGCLVCRRKIAVRTRASSLKFQCRLFSLRPSSSGLHRLPCRLFCVCVCVCVCVVPFEKQNVTSSFGLSSFYEMQGVPLFLADMWCVLLHSLLQISLTFTEIPLCSKESK